ncbi:MAG: S8 family serine peptidase [Acidobacteriota bacterium]
MSITRNLDTRREAHKGVVLPPLSHIIASAPPIKLEESSPENRFSIIPTPQRLDVDLEHQGEGITIAFLDSGFYAHPDLIQPENRILKYIDITRPEDGDRQLYEPANQSWHGMQTSVAAAGNGYLSGGCYRGIAARARLVLVKVGSKRGIEPENITAGLKWVLEHKDTYGIRVVNISLGGDDDIPYQTSAVDLAAEALVAAGVVVVVAAGNSGCTDQPNLTPPGNSPSVITVGGYDDKNQPDSSGPKTLCDTAPAMYCSSYGHTADGFLKPELLAPAIWIPAPLLPGTKQYLRAQALWKIANEPRYGINRRTRELWEEAELPELICDQIPPIIRAMVERALKENKIIHPYYQHVDGTSFAAPIITSIVAQMLEINPKLTPAMVKHILTSTADRVPYFPLIRQGFGILDAREAIREAGQESATRIHQVLPSPVIKDGALAFLYNDEQATSVSLASDFNDWDISSMPFHKGTEGLWEITVPAPSPGRYRYKYVLDGSRWIDDPGNGMREPDGFNGFNSVVKISR